MCAIIISALTRHWRRRMCGDGRKREGMHERIAGDGQIEGLHNERTRQGWGQLAQAVSAEAQSRERLELSNAGGQRVDEVVTQIEKSEERRYLARHEPRHTFESVAAHIQKP